MSEPVRPGAHRSAALVRQPAFWVVIVLLAVGAVRISQIMAIFLKSYPIATLTAILLFGLLAVPFWLFLSELDFMEREPPSLRVVAFAWGGLVATSVSIPGSTALDNLIAKLGSPDLAAEWGAALAGPTVEEIAKTLGVVAIVLIARSQINSVLDGIVYGALVGLGFQIVEDVVFAIGAVRSAGEGDQVQPVITTFLVRGFLAGVWSHTLFGALAGAGIGYLVVNRERGRPRRIAVAGLALFGAWASHSLWNSPLFRESLGDGAVALLAVLLFKGLPPLLLVLYLVRRAHDREAAYYVGILATVRERDLITEEELRVLGSGSRRGAARRHAAARAGRKARAAVRRLQRAQAGLAVELSRAEAGIPDEATPARAAEVREHRATLAALGHPEAVEGTRSWRHTASTLGTVAVAIAVVWVALSALGGA
ncbi:PrsW family intramembrane metalloprotease [Actinoplanes sp. NPDC023801]|uniref:PrsW family intramembrane metalloprotease n=1 Tax=Actinoplanes sp. NPDC023801 TaxID=3154595 RepID=UPI0033E034BC